MAYNRALVTIHQLFDSHNAATTAAPPHAILLARNPNGRPKNTACLGSAGHVDGEKHSGEQGTRAVDYY
jgi:hypothetical protein